MCEVTSLGLLRKKSDPSLSQKKKRPQSSSIKQLEQIVQRLVQATERDGEVSLFMSRYNLLKYGQIKVIYTCKMLLIVT